MAEIDDAAPGWDAIDAALARIYPGVEPQHYGTLIKWRLGGPDPLDGISVYAREDHWHIVTYGLSELYGKESDDPTESGWGFELTFRPTRRPDETDHPMWALNFLQNIARYVFSSGNPFGPGHHMNLNGPISLAAPETAIRAITFADDPELGVISTVHGQLRFLQVVGLTLEEYAVIERWDVQQLLAAMAPHLPLLVTDLARGDLTVDPDLAPAIEEGARRDGSSTSSLYVKEARWRPIKPPPGGPDMVVTFGANAAERIGRVIAARLPYGRDVVIQGADKTIVVRPTAKRSVTDQGDGVLELGLPAAAVTHLVEALRPVAGVQRLRTVPELGIEIVKSQIRSPDGTVIAEIG
jgi:suppressor of fused